MYFIVHYLYYRIEYFILQKLYFHLMWVKDWVKQ